MQITYDAGSLSARQLREALPDVVHSVVSDPVQGPRFLALGYDQDSLLAAVSFEPGSSGIDGGTASVLVALAPSAVHIANSLWDDVLLPTLRRVCGLSALGPELDRRDG